MKVQDVQVEKYADAWGVRDPSQEREEAERAVSASANHKRWCDVRPLPRASKSVSKRNR